MPIEYIFEFLDDRMQVDFLTLSFSFFFPPFPLLSL